MSKPVTAGATRVHQGFRQMTPQEEKYLNSEVDKIEELIKTAEIHTKNAETIGQKRVIVQGKINQATATQMQARAAKEQAQAVENQAQKAEEQARKAKEQALDTKEAARIRSEATEELVVKKLAGKLKRDGTLSENEMKIYKDFSAKIAARSKK